MMALTAAPTGTAAAEAGDPVVAAAGDIACDPGSSSFNGGLGTSGSCRQKHTSDLLVGANLAAVLPLGDNQYDNGALTKYGASYDASWGRVKAITRPTPGNHDPWGSSGYDEYFGVPRYYAWDVGGWRLYALDSNSVDAAQISWLESDLAANPRRCVGAYWHHATFSSGSAHGSDSRTRPFWETLYAAGAELVLAGHDHTYERFAPQTSSGQRDEAHGLREFVVGTGGRSHYGFGPPLANSEVRNADTFGVLQLTLHADSYDWRFMPEAGKTFTDSGSQVCDGASGDTEAPSAPTNLIATAASSSRVNLSWSPSTDNVGISGYEIFRDGALRTTVMSTNHADTTVTAGKTYSYQVRARDASGNRSALSSSAVATTPTSAYTTRIYFPVADARVEEDARKENLGTSYLGAKNGSRDDLESYLRFSVSGVSGPVRSAKLRFYAYDGTLDGPAVYRSGDAWTEAGITWRQRPARTSGPLGDRGSIGTNTWFQYDVTRSVVGNGTYSFVLAGMSSDEVDMYSREASSLRPRLVVTFG
jgi:hypothetical protein